MSNLWYSKVSIKESIMPSKDPVKRREAKRKWSAKNREKNNEYSKKSRIKKKAEYDALPEVIARREAYRLQLIEWALTKPAREAEKRERQNIKARARRAEKARLEGRVLGRNRKVMTAEEKREKKAINRKNRRYAERNAEGKLSVGIRKKLLVLQKGCCTICKEKLILSGERKYHLDHVIPISSGGTNYDENIQLLCFDCNVSKSNKDSLVFMQSKGYLI
jgi:5-methylcytosine-specific restriction endonuclease McrA